MTTTRFALAPAVVRIEPLGAELLVFNAVSLETHLLNQAAGAVLRFISLSPRSAAEVAALLAVLLVERERPAAARHATATVEQLESLGLVVGTGQP